MQSMIHLFHRIIEMIIAKLSFIKSINTNYICELWNNIN